MDSWMAENLPKHADYHISISQCLNLKKSLMEAVKKRDKTVC